MSKEYKETGFELDLDEKEAEKFIKILKDEGLMRAGFVIHESNNLTVSVNVDPDSEKKNNS